MESFGKRLLTAMEERGKLCVGIDPHAELLGAWGLSDDAAGVAAFSQIVVDALAERVAVFKPQSAFFERFGARGAQILESTIRQLREAGAVVILDAKRGDIGSTAQHYATEAFDRYRADAVTANPYLGRDAVQPFLDHTEKGVILLCRTSNPGARDLQDLDVGGRPLYQHVAQLVARDWNGNGNCAVVVGATYPAELAAVRALIGDMTILVPGVGAQGGDAAAVIRNGKNSQGSGLIISSSRAILYASSGADFADAARREAQKLRDEINRSR